MIDYRMIDPRVIDLCREFNVEIIPGTRYPEVGQTRAPDTLRRIIDRYGIEHARMVMTTICLLYTSLGQGGLLDGLGYGEGLSGHHRT